MTRLLSGALSMTIGLPALAAISFSDGATHDITTVITSDVTITNSGSSVTTVNVLPGGAIVGEAGDTVPNAVELTSGQLNLTGGSITGGNIPAGPNLGFADGIAVEQSGQLNFFSGTIMGGSLDGTSGIADAVLVRGGLLTMSGGEISGGGGSGGGISNAVIVNSSGVANIFGGTISCHTSFQDAIVDGGGTVNIYGGIMDGNITSSSSASRVNIFGGDIQGSLEPDAPGGVITVAGNSFNFPFGSISTTSGRLTGTLADGTPINAAFSRAGGGQIILIPEPGSIGMVVLAPFIFFRRTGSSRKGTTENVTL
jgi:hypothetical protein